MSGRQIRLRAPIEWKLYDGGGDQTVANFDRDTHARGRGRPRSVADGKITHRDRPPDRRSHRSARDNSRFAPILKNLVPLASDAARIVGFDSWQPRAQSAFALRSQCRLSYKRPSQFDEHAEARFQRRGRSVEFVPIQGQAGFKP